MAASFKRHHGAQRRRHDGKTREEHPLWADSRATKRLRKRQALAQLVAFCCRGFLVELFHLLNEIIEVDVSQDVVERLSSDGGTEHRAVFNSEEMVGSFIQDGTALDGIYLFLRLCREVFESGLFVRIVCGLSF